MGEAILARAAAGGGGKSEPKFKILFSITSGSGEFSINAAFWDEIGVEEAFLTVLAYGMYGADVDAVLSNGTVSAIQADNTNHRTWGAAYMHTMVLKMVRNGDYADLYYCGYIEGKEGRSDLYMSNVKTIAGSNACALYLNY